MQPTPLLSKSLGESTCTRERNHNACIYRLVSAFDCHLNVACSSPLGYTFDHSFQVLSWKVLRTSGELGVATTTTNFSKESKYLKWPESFFQGIPVPKFIQGLCFFRSQYIPRNPNNPKNGKGLSFKSLWSIQFLALHFLG